MFFFSLTELLNCLMDRTCSELQTNQLKWREMFLDFNKRRRRKWFLGKQAREYRKKKSGKFNCKKKIVRTVRFRYFFVFVIIIFWVRCLVTLIVFRRILSVLANFFVMRTSRFGLQGSKTKLRVYNHVIHDRNWKITFNAPKIAKLSISAA